MAEIDRKKVDEALLQILRRQAWNFIRRATPEQLRLMRDVIDKRLANGQDAKKV